MPQKVKRIKQYEPDNTILLVFEIWFNEQVEYPL